jgi:hypothetical protein
MKIQGNHMEIIMEIMQSYDDFEIGNQGIFSWNHDRPTCHDQILPFLGPASEVPSN